MANKRWSDVMPNRDDKDSKVAAKQPSGKTKPTGNPSAGSFKGPGSSNEPRLKEKGGKDLPCPKFESYNNRSGEAQGELPKKGA